MRITISTLARASRALPLVLVAGCVASSTVAEPDGSTAYDVSCSRGSLCLHEAESLCGGEYVVLNQSIGYRSGGGMRVQCTEEYLSTRTPQAPLNLENAPRPERGDRPFASLRESERLVCTKAYERIDVVAEAWSAARRMPRAAALPEEVAFLETCTSLPEATQVCLVPTYARAHREACRERMLAIPPVTRRSLDTLLAQPPIEARAAASNET